MEAFIESRQATRRSMAPALDKKRKEEKKFFPLMTRISATTFLKICRVFLPCSCLSIRRTNQVMWSATITLTTLLVSGEKRRPNSEFAATSVLICGGSRHAFHGNEHFQHLAPMYIIIIPSRLVNTVERK